MSDLKTNYKDDVLNTEVNERRKYQMIQNDDGTVSFVDVTDYSQVGDSFGAVDINATNEKCNEINNSLVNAQNSISSLNSNLAKNIISTATAVQLENGVNYTTPSDGYFNIGCTYEQNNYIRGSVDGIVMMACASPKNSNGTTFTVSSIFVRKGTIINIDTNFAGGNLAYFYPLN